MNTSLNEVLNKLKEFETNHPEIDVEVEVKRAIVQHFQKLDYSKTKILDILNYFLELWDKDTVTIGCVKHHWK